ncbi:hypothetical protein [uncultured Tateyamaria sp.]|uniref:hypothetical protein n=1 Tax=uncultured Tateyamaria sp. TaxID=455651 RepID=UPI0026246623|nr:hypothetical protein [uncultured Tateyamaria sp.]
MKYTLIPGQSHEPSEEETMSMIRSLLTEDSATPPTSNANATIDATPDAQDTATKPRAFVEQTTDPAPRRRASDLPELEEPAQPTRPGLLARARSVVARPITLVFDLLRAFQPKTRHLAIASAALLFVVRPHWFVIGAALTLMLGAGAFLTLGADRIWRGVLAWLNRVETRDSARAADLRTRLDAFACRWDGVLDLLPDGTADSLYMPDFQAMQQADIDHQTVVADRLDRMVQES